MNSTDGELLKEVLVLEKLSANPKVGLMLVEAVPQWISELHAAYLEGFVPKLRRGKMKQDFPPKKGLKLPSNPR